MVLNVAILGCGKLGSQISICLAKKYGKETIYPTTRNRKTLQKLISEFPNAANDNISAVKKSDIICIITQPEEVSDLMKEIKPYLDKDKIVINFTPKKIIGKSPIINVAGSPVIKGKIKILLYNNNKYVGSLSLKKFKEYFLPITNYLNKCDDVAKELGVMSRVYTHILNYYRHLRKEGNSHKNLEAYFSLVFDTLSDYQRIEDAITNAQTKKGITKELFKTYKKDNSFSKFVNKEKITVDKKIKLIQED